MSSYAAQSLLMLVMFYASGGPIIRNVMRLISVMFLLLLVACATRGTYVWVNEDTSRQNERRLLIDRLSCDAEAAKISIPEPSCTVVAINFPPCAFVIGGVCDATERTALQCDDTGVEAAKAAQVSQRASCMEARGWSSVWQTSGKK
tara:strand:+ start:66 stop:506 length:441 start_codon:yes stop_codon:yes gene_type:complete